MINYNPRNQVQQHLYQEVKKYRIKSIIGNIQMSSLHNEEYQESILQHFSENA